MVAGTITAIVRWLSDRVSDGVLEGVDGAGGTVVDAGALLAVVDVVALPDEDPLLHAANVRTNPVRPATTPSFIERARRSTVTSGPRRWCDVRSTVVVRTPGQSTSPLGAHYGGGSCPRWARRATPRLSNRRRRWPAGSLATDGRRRSGVPGQLRGDLSRRLGGDGDGPGQDLVVVRHPGEQRLVGARGERHPAPKHGVEQAAIDAVAPQGERLVVTGRRSHRPSRGPDEEPHQGTHVRGDRRKPAVVHGRGEGGGERGRPPPELLVVPLGDLREDGQAGGRRQRVPREGAGLVHGAGRGERAEHVPAPTERADGQAPADHLAQAPQVGCDTEPVGGAAGPEPESGDDLVEDEQGPGGVTGPA